MTFPVFYSSKRQEEETRSLRKGAVMYVDTCLGCHSMKGITYQDMAQVLKMITPSELQWMRQVLVPPTVTHLHAPIESAFSASDAKRWFGTVPPDLTDITQARGERWMIDFLNGFYEDQNNLWASKHRTHTHLRMPDPLITLKGRWVLSTESGLKTLQCVRAGALDPPDYQYHIESLVHWMHEAPRCHRGSPVWGISLFMIGLLWITLIYCVFLKHKTSDQSRHDST